MMGSPSQWRRNRTPSQDQEFAQETYPLSPQHPICYPDEHIASSRFQVQSVVQGSTRASPEPAGRAYSTPGHNSFSRRQRQQPEYCTTNFATTKYPRSTYQGLSDDDGWQPAPSASATRQVSNNPSPYSETCSAHNVIDDTQNGTHTSHAHGDQVDHTLVAKPTSPLHTVSASNSAYTGNTAEESNPYLRDAQSFSNRSARALKVKAWLGWTSSKHYHKNAFFGRRFPGSYQLPGYYYKPKVDGSLAKGKHQDAFRRQFQGWDDDRYLDPLDGKIRKLYVQTIDEIYDGHNDTSWRRTYIRNISPWLLRLAWWPYSHMPERDVQGVQQDKFIMRARLDSLKSRTKSWDVGQWAQVGLYWLPACLGLLFLMCGPTDVEGQVRNHGCYDPVPYRYWSYPKSARNFYENIGARPSSGLSYENDSRLKQRRILPKFLCFLDCQNESPRGRMDPKKWIEKHHDQYEPSYIFVSYTAEKQFGRPCEAVRKRKRENCSCPVCETSRSDADVLHYIAVIAAKQAGVAAYWTDQCCMSSDKLSDDVYDISDVVRNAQRIAIVVGCTGCDHLPPNLKTIDLLQGWGSRMWTWPEVLLGPSKKSLYVYTRGTNLEQPQKFSKLNFAEQVWPDSAVARQLLDYYEGTMTLSRLELVVLALESLKSRVEHGTTKFSEGDLSYALMGLLKHRPKVETTDSAFQAFARLSLSNDSDRLLERMISLLPTAVPVQVGETSEIKDSTAKKGTSTVPPAQSSNPAERRRHYWTNTNDYWGARLWDIEPTCQIAGIAANDTVILDGAYGATVHWDTFQRIAITTRETWSRTLTRFCVRGTPFWFLLGLLLVAVSPPPSAGFSGTALFGALFLITGIILILLSPYLILHLYSGKVWNSQPWLLGFEGHMAIKDIERKIWGFPCGRLSWAPYGSSLSRHRVNKQFLEDECEGTDPLLGDSPDHEPCPVTTGDKEPEPLRQFTIVDTFTMTVSMCSAVRPPVVALLCGAEGGMQRAVMCSYDWTSQTFYRETVLRMETRVLERMPRIGRVRFGLRRWRGEEVVRVQSCLRPP